MTARPVSGAGRDGLAQETPGPEFLGAGFLPRDPAPDGMAGVPGFASGGMLDVLEPGPALAGLADRAATCGGGLAGLDDDSLVGMMRAWRRLAAWATAGELAAIAELAHRRPSDDPARAGCTGGRPDPASGLAEHVSEFASDEIAAALVLSGQAASKHLGLALDLAARLPATAAALREGVIDYLKARIIGEATTVLGDEHTAAVEARVVPGAGQMTAGQLRAALARAILVVDPQAAARRREEAHKDARVRRWREDAGTAALAGYGLPPAEVLAADQRIDARARALRNAGIEGTMDELRARAYLDALLDRPLPDRPLPDQAAPAGPATASTADDPRGTDAPGSPIGAATPDSRDGQTHADGRDRTESTVSPGDCDRLDEYGTGTGQENETDTASRGGPGGRGRPGTVITLAARVNPPPLAARVNLTIPLATLLGQGNGPGAVAGFGSVDADCARDLAAAAAAYPATRWCLTITDTNGQAIGHGCAAGQHTIPGSPGDDAAGPDHGLTVTITPLARGHCDHRSEEPGYVPSRHLRHLIQARTATCSFPGCGRPAAQCDLDHTLAYDMGGRTCECGLAPLCRHHHRCKQAPGWQLSQGPPGLMHWTTPAGHQYVTRPTTHPT